MLGRVMMHDCKTICFPALPDQNSVNPIRDHKGRCKGTGKGEKAGPVQLGSKTEPPEEGNGKTGKAVQGGVHGGLNLLYGG